MAKAAEKTTAAAAKLQEQSLLNYRRLEVTVHDLEMMARVTCSIMEKFFKDTASLRKDDYKDVPIKRAIEHIGRDGEELMYCVYTLNQLAQETTRIYSGEPEVAQ